MSTAASFTILMEISITSFMFAGCRCLDDRRGRVWFRGRLDRNVRSTFGLRIPIGVATQDVDDPAFTPDIG